MEEKESHVDALGWGADAGRVSVAAADDTADAARVGDECDAEAARVDEEVFGSAVECFSDRSGIANGDCQGAEQVEILAQRYPQSHIGAVQFLGREFEHRGHGCVSDQEFVAVQGGKGESCTGREFISVAAKFLDDVADATQACRSHPRHSEECRGRWRDQSNCWRDSSSSMDGASIRWGHGFHTFGTRPGADRGGLRFIAEHIAPIEHEYHQEVAQLRAGGGDPWIPLPIVAELRSRARAAGLWNLFLPAGHERDYAERYGTCGGTGLSNVDYAPVAETMGRSFLAPYVFNSNAPDTGNAEVLLKYGSTEQQARWLDPLLAGEIRSAFCMTEPGVASSDATNMELSAVVDGDEVVLNGRKWWSTGVGHPDCQILLVMGVTAPEADRHRRHSMVLVPVATPGVKVERLLDTMGFQDELRTRGGQLHRRPGAGREHHRRAGARFRDRPGATGSGTGASLHAPDRFG